MATYVLPQVQVFQDFQVTPSVAANPLRAHISGGHAYLVRYSDADEQLEGRLGHYDPIVDTCYSWPNRPAGAVIDDDYTKIWIKNALLRYFSDQISGGSTITKTAGYNNRVRSDSVNFQTNGIYSRSSLLFDRDVQLGDIVRLRVVPAGDDPVYLWTYVKDILGDEVSASIAAASADSSNADTQAVSPTAAAVQTDGAENCVTVVPDGDAYDGLPSGYINETYTLLVLSSSVDGDYTAARIRVISASGLDDELEVTPSAAGEPTAIGSRGLTVIFDTDSSGACSTSAENDDVSPTDLIAGQEWEVTVSQPFTAPVATSAGTYTEESSTTYIVSVTKGGVWADLPQISVTTTNGIDISGPTTVTAAATAVAIGSRGVTIAFSGDGLRKGDRYYVVVTGVEEGPLRTIELGHNIPSTVPADSEVGVDLYILKPTLEVTENRTGFAPLVNWVQSETEICLNSGIIGYDESWTDDGELLALDVVSESSQDYGVAYVELITGPLHPDNPLKWGVFKALSNSNGTQVKYTAVPDPDDEDDWVSMLERLLGRDDVYGLVPLTRNRTVQDLFAAHVDAQSAPESGLWRVTWFNLAGIPTIPIVHTGSTVSGYTTATTTDGELALATFEDDAQTSGSQYTILQVPEGNAAFLENGVQPGDIVRALYAGDGFGNYTYSEYVVDAVQSEDQLRLLTGPDAPQSVPAKIEIWRNLTATEEAAEIARDAGSWNNRRVRAVWPDQIESSGTIQEGYHLCAALAGLSSGILPHQGMTRLEVAGFSDVPRTTSKFNRPQLDTIAVSGGWIVTQDIIDGEIYTRQAVTTGDYENIVQREEMITRNVDSISYRFKDHFEPYIGVTNVNPSMQSLLAYETRKLIEVLKRERFTEQLGGQIVSATLVSLEQHATQKDRFVMTLQIVIPFPLNVFEIHIVI
jgi:exosome complex RNA-binding protein Csl4